MEKATELRTDVLPVDISTVQVKHGHHDSKPFLGDWTIELQEGSVDARNIRRAATELQHSDIPVAFPTETVYGLGADATRSAAVQGIYKAKQRPSDNPLIVHIHSLQQLRALLQPSVCGADQQNINQNISDSDARIEAWDQDSNHDPIPPIYRSLISRFWPGPLTLIMPNPEHSFLAPEVTAGLPTFGVRMPRNLHALALLKLANVPLAAPSANASSKPSPTEAGHVKHDLNGRISTIIDGGPCEVGVESTVVDGLSDPPAVLRPGGVSIEEIRSCPGWSNVTIGYKDMSETLEERPRAPGMKYRHYSPRAPVILYEHGKSMPPAQEMESYLRGNKRLGVIRTATWPEACGLPTVTQLNGHTVAEEKTLLINGDASIMSSPAESTDANAAQVAKAWKLHVKLGPHAENVELWDINLEASPELIARGLFAALRELDKLDVDAIIVEGVDDSRGDVSAAVMNRLRKAAEVKI